MSKKTSKKMKQIKIFNPNSKETVNQRRIFGGDPDGITNDNEIKYPWALDLFIRQEQATWFRNETSMENDDKDYNQRLTIGQISMYDLILGRLIFMDSAQPKQLNYLSLYITAEEVYDCIVRQSYEEVQHAKSYQTMSNTFIKGTEDKSRLFNLWRKEPKLEKMNKKVAKVYNKFIKKPTLENLIKGVFANLLLEGVYFYTGFAAIYALGMQGLMLGSVNMIRYIQRDEVNHTELMANILKECKRENPEVFTPEFTKELYKMLMDAYKLESSWGQFVIGKGEVGLTKKIMDDYAKHRVNVVSYMVRDILPNKPFPETKNPLEWINKYSLVPRGNGFEDTLTDYVVASLEDDELNFKT